MTNAYDNWGKNTSTIPSNPLNSLLALSIIDLKIRSDRFKLLCFIIIDFPPYILGFDTS